MCSLLPDYFRDMHVLVSHIYLKFRNIDNKNIYLDYMQILSSFQMKTAADLCVLYDINKKQRPWIS